MSRETEPRFDWPQLVLRIGLAQVLWHFGWAKCVDPTPWFMYVPEPVRGALESLSPAGLERVMRFQGGLELVLGTQVALGWFTRAATLLTTALLAAIVVSFGNNPLGVRDAGLLALAVAVLIQGPRHPSVDTWRQRGPARTTAGTREGIWRWSLGLGLFAFVFLTAPEPPRPEKQFHTGRASMRAPIEPIPNSVRVSPSKVTLGRQLFNDPALSADETVSCASCHSSSLAGGDGRSVPVGIDGQLGSRNSPTVFNSAYNFRQFWDGRAATLEEQVGGPIENALEMGASWDLVLSRLNDSPQYRRLFGATYSDGVTAANVRDAIAEFERSLITPNAPFDRYLRGERDAISIAAARGYESFVELGCISCHHGRNVGGTSFQTMGAMREFFLDPTGADPGLFAVTGREEDRYKFKVPSLRNVALTGPYFHDGSVATLKEAVRVMGRFQLGYELSDEQVDDLVAFLTSLTGDQPRI